jgi:hypothetical protein
MRIVSLAAAVGFATALAACAGSVDGEGTGPPPPDAPTTKDILREWSGCMTQTNFQAADMASAWGTLVSSGNKQCQNCHGDGAYGFFASSDQQPFFDAITKHSSWMAMYFSVSAGKVVINKDSFKAANSEVGHPTFDAENNQGMTALTNFYNATLAMTACEPPRMID